MIDTMTEEMHKYEIKGKERIGSIRVSVRTTIVAYNKEQAIYLANKDQISVRRIKDLGTITEQKDDWIKKCFQLPKR